MHSNRTPTFIIVDDDPLNNSICELLIGKVFKYSDIKLFTWPEMALEFISKKYGKTGANNPTILFLDIDMPTLNGWDFLDEFKNFSDSIQEQFTIFIVSSSVSKQDKEKAAKYKSVSGLISKPLTKDSLKKIFDKGRGKRRF